MFETPTPMKHSDTKMQLQTALFLKIINKLRKSYSSVHNEMQLCTGMNTESLLGLVLF